MVVTDLHCRFALQIYCCIVQLSCTNLNCLSLPLLDFLKFPTICTDFRLNCKIPMQGLSGVSYWPIEVRTGRGAQRSDFPIILKIELVSIRFSWPSPPSWSIFCFMYVQGTGNRGPTSKLLPRPRRVRCRSSARTPAWRKTRSGHRWFIL